MVETTTEQREALDLEAMHERIAFTRTETCRLCFGSVTPTERARVRRWARDGRLPQLAICTPGSAVRVTLTLRGDYERFHGADTDGVQTVRAWQRQGGRLVTAADLERATGLSVRFWQKLAKIGAAHGGLDPVPRGDARGLLYFRRDDVAEWLLRLRPAARYEA